MTTLVNRPNTAILVVDVQNGVVKRAHERDAVVGNIDTLVSRARREAITVVWVQHCSEELPKGSDNWRIVPELAPAETEPLRRTMEMRSRIRTLRPCCRVAGLVSSSWSAHRRTLASALRFTVRASGGMT